MTDEGGLPPVVVYFDGSSYWLADGHLRVFAHREIGALKIDANVHAGGRRDAELHAVGANAAHGLPRTNEDKRKAVNTLLADQEWSQWSDREIARRCHVGHPMVAALRATVTGRNSSEDRKYKTKHGTTATMGVAGVSEANKKRKKPGNESVASDATPGSVASDATPVESDSTADTPLGWASAQAKSKAGPDAATPRDKSHEEPGAAEELSRLRELLSR